ncbi:hypothetical protein B1B_16027, partial [mine drainage metagenome]
MNCPFPLQEAVPLFTPMGERLWAQGWDPAFPAPAADDSEPGTIFQTDHAGRLSIWTVIHRNPGGAMGYATTTPGDRAGTVAVSCQPMGSGTRVTVSYDLTALTPTANDELTRFAMDYPDFLAHW